jgi:hypothetical protein
MSDFDTRPQGTVMYGAFNAFAAAERALRVLKNAGYARAAFEHASEDEGEGTALGGPAVVVVDAAKTGAARAAEILEEFGAQIHLSPPRALAPAAQLDELPANTAFAEQTIVPEQTATLAPEQTSLEAAIAAPLHVTSAPERKPRVRKRRRAEMPRPNAISVASEPPVRENVIIVTRAVENFANDG